jgi:hypothetical protein
MAPAHIDVVVDYGTEKMWCLKVQMLLSGMRSKNAR